MGRAELIKGEVNEEIQFEGDLVCIHLQDYEVSAILQGVPIFTTSNPREGKHAVFTIRLDKKQEPYVRIVQTADQTPQRYTIYLSADGAELLRKEHGVYQLDMPKNDITRDEISNFMIDIRKSNVR